MDGWMSEYAVVLEEVLCSASMEVGEVEDEVVAE